MSAVSKFVLAMAEIADGGNEAASDDAKAIRARILKELATFADNADAAAARMK